MRYHTFNRSFGKFLFGLILFTLLVACSAAQNATKEVRVTEFVTSTPLRITLPTTSGVSLPTSTSTPTLHPSETRTLIPTVQSTKIGTPIPTAQSTQTVTVTRFPLSTLDASILNLLPTEPAILYMDESGTYYDLQNIITGETWPIFDYTSATAPGDYHSYRFLAWSRNGCEIDAWNGDSHKIQRLDLQGNVVGDLYSLETLKAAGFKIALAPRQDKFAFHAVGRFYTPNADTYSGQFMEIVDLNNPQKRLRISEQDGGEAMMAWSPDGRWLGYAEYDAHDVLQVHIVKPDGSDRQQLTQFVEPHTMLANLAWSPDSQHIAFSYDKNMDDPYWNLAVISLQDQTHQVKFVEHNGYKIVPNYFWWQNETTLVVQAGDVFWFDVEKNEFTNFLSETMIPEGYITGPRPLGELGLIGLFSDSTMHFYIYDPHTQRLISMPNAQKPFFDTLDNWISVPPSFTGVDRCKR